ncbi:hypothetical protein B0H14DRAFT_3478048 [Mycena olivaceomarginata]|nr:hypothetical protein B0H14DRAFT_3478048 [Mycena olivaceomarginata]
MHIYPPFATSQQVPEDVDSESCYSVNRESSYDEPACLDIIALHSDSEGRQIYFSPDSILAPTLPTPAHLEEPSSSDVFAASARRSKKDSLPAKSNIDTCRLSVGDDYGDGMFDEARKCPRGSNQDLSSAKSNIALCRFSVGDDYGNQIFEEARMCTANSIALGREEAMIRVSSPSPVYHTPAHTRHRGPIEYHPEPQFYAYKAPEDGCFLRHGLKARSGVPRMDKAERNYSQPAGIVP